MRTRKDLAADVAALMNAYGTLQHAIGLLETRANPHAVDFRSLRFDWDPAVTAHVWELAHLEDRARTLYMRAREKLDALGK